MSTDTNNIARHKTAIRRPSFSLPIKCLLRDGLLDSTKTLFDYGCGHGQDLKLLADMDIAANGWDPVFRPKAKKQRADVLLFRAGDPEAIDAACQRAEVGRLVDNALIVHRSALDYLQPLLRIYEGCARALVGEIDEANVIKLHRFSGKVSYLAYASFEKDPHPALRLRVKVTLPTLSIDLFDYSDWDDPPILCRKEKLLHKDHELYSRFSRLTRQEEKYGVLNDGVQIDRRSQLQNVLREKQLVLRGHCLNH